MIVRGELPGDVGEVLRRLRAWNVKELEAALGSGYHNAFRYWVAERAAKRYAIQESDRVLAVFGFFDVAPKHWGVYFQATDAFEPLAALSVRPLRRVLKRDTASHGIVKVTSHALAGNPKSPRWFEALGAHRNSSVFTGASVFDVYEWDTKPCASEADRLQRIG